MDISVTCKRISGTLTAVTSKSDVHRELICAALADRESVVTFNALSEDIKATVRCLVSLGAQIDFVPEGARVIPIKKINKNAVLDCGESGSTLRFMLPVAAALGADAEFCGGGRLFERPLEPLVSLMKKHGVNFYDDPLKISGRMSGGFFEIPGNISSQFITGLLLALPLCGGGKVKIIPPVESKKYIDMTVETIKSFGADVTIADNVYTVPDKKFAAINDKHFSEGDWSNAAFFLCAAAISGDVRVTNLSADSLQGDKKIAGILAQFGADVSIEKNSVTVKSNELHGFDIDASQIPDLVPVLAATAAFAGGTTKIYNASRLRLKESDRLFAVSHALKNIGADVTELDDGLIISGKPNAVYSGTADSFNDHRIAMSLAVASANGGRINITNCQAVNKSYPSFFEDFKSLGGICNVL